MKNEFITFGKPSIEKEEIKELLNTLESGWIGTGPKVQKFEESFRRYKEAKFSLALSSCTASLHLALLMSKIVPGDEVIVPVMTFAATANTVVHVGAKPVFVDCEKESMNIDPEKIEEKITSKTKAIIVVHFAGRPCDMDKILKISKKYKLKVIEDCAHAIETKYKGKPSGNFGDFGCFSFYATKNITTGEGGMIVTKSKKALDKLKVLSMHGQTKSAWNRSGANGFTEYLVVEPGYKYNMTDIQASLGIHQLSRIESSWKKRKNIWERYNFAFKDLPIITPKDEGPGNKHAYHLYTILLDSKKGPAFRKMFIEKMLGHNIGIGIHYTTLHLQPYYKNKFKYKKSDFPNANWISERTVSLPFYSSLTENEINRIIEAVKKSL